MTDCSMMTVPVDSPYHKIFQQGRKRIETVVQLKVPGDLRPQAKCTAVDSQTIEKHLMFNGTVQGKRVRIWLDTGATHCFAGERLKNLLKLDLQPSQLKGVETANGHNNQILGSSDLKVKFTDAPIHHSWDMNVSFLPQFLKGVDLIVGQDWMIKHACHILFDEGQSSLTHPDCTERVFIPQLQVGQYYPKDLPHPQVPESSPGMISAALMARYMNRCGKNGYKFELLVVKPKPVQSSPVMASMQPGPMDTAPERPLTEEEKFDKVAADLLKSVEKVQPSLVRDLMLLLQEYKNVFSERPKPEGANLPPAEHVIDLVEGTCPTHRRNFRFSPVEVKELIARVEEFLEKGLITPSNSPFGAPILFIKKPDGSLRFTLDYRALNQVTHKIRYPLPRIDDLLDAARGAEFFSTLDLASGYYQLKIDPKDSHKTAFVTPYGQFEWKVLPMGLCNAPSAFMKTMNSVFDQVISKDDLSRAKLTAKDLGSAKRFKDFLLIYLDDLLVMSKTPEEHLIHLRLILSKMQHCNLSLKLSKCHFLQEQVKYLGHVLSSKGIQPSPDKVQLLLDWKMPDTVLGMQQFLGLANYFRKFIQNYSRIAAPLYSLTKSTGAFQSGEETSKAFADIKKMLTSAPILRYPDPDKPYLVISDASVTGCGAILIQDEHPVAYYSYKFSDPERKYTTGEQEYYGIVKALEEWRCYLEGCVKLTVWTDHNPLTFMSVQPNLSRRQARWLEKMSRFDFEVQYKSGHTNPADGLSRIHEGTEPATLAVMNALTDWEPVQCAVVIAEIDPNPELMTRIAEASVDDPGIMKHEGKLHQESEGHFTFHGLIVVPEAVQKEVISLHHDSLTAGHFGQRKTMASIQREFFWPNMAGTVAKYIRRCDSCQRNKSITAVPYGLLQPIQIPDTRWQVVTMDFVTGLPVSRQGNNCILVMVDKLTKYVVLVPTVKKLTALDCSELFIIHIFQSKGLPDKIISDRDKLFTSQFWKEFMHHLKVKLRMSTAYHPQTDGQTEKVNSVVEQVLRAMVNEPQTNWESLLPYVSFAINNSRAESTGETPFFLNSGSHPRAPAQVGRLQITDHIPALGVVLTEMYNTLDSVKVLLKRAQDRQKTYADKKRREHTFKARQQVLLSIKNFRFPAGQRKLQGRYLGPFEIEEMVGSNAAKLRLPESMSRFHPVFHVSLLRPYYADKGYQPANKEVRLRKEDSPELAVETVLAHRLKRIGKFRNKKFKKEYLIKWAGFDASHNTWEPEGCLNEAALESYRPEQ